MSFSTYPGQQTQPMARPQSGLPYGATAGMPGAGIAGYPAADPYNTTGSMYPGQTSPNSIYAGQQGAGYPAAIGGRAVPHGGDPQLWQWFTSVDTDRSGSITADELQRALVNGNWSNFDLDTVKMLMNIFDADRSGTINFAEFSGLWKYIADWQNVFKHFDRDASGTIEGRELSEALQSFGYSFSREILTLVERKYSAPPTSTRGPAPGISFDRFVRACVAVKTLTEAFQKVDTDKDGLIQITYEHFMQIVLSAP